MKDLDLTADVIDIRDVIERYEELESIRDNQGGTFNELLTADQFAELQTLRDLLNELKGAGGDEQWRDDWYPITLINSSYFTEYTRELLEDCGYIPNDFPSWIAIDWDKTAEAVKIDYVLVTIGDNDYWYR